jgi:hypothetical protein
MKAVRSVNFVFNSLDHALSLRMRVLAEETLKYVVVVLVVAAAAAAAAAAAPWTNCPIIDP